MSDEIRKALFALADRIEEANGKPISVDTAAAYALRAALTQQPAQAAPVAQKPARELIGYACDKRGALMPDRCGDCLCWPAYQDAPPAAEQPAHAVPVAQEPVAWPAAAHNLVRDWQTGMASSNEVCIALASALCGTPPAVEQPDAWTPSVADYDRNIHRNPDAAAWADLFVATFPGLADKHDLMLGWFANAMMAMHDFLKAEQPDAVAVPRELLSLDGKAVAASAAPVAVQPLPYWAPCNPACDPELNGSRSKLCDCAQATAALAAPPAALTRQPDAGHELFAELYQILGELGANEAVLDQVLAASHGDPLPHTSLLPYAAKIGESKE